jgi:hypothetical protein
VAFRYRALGLDIVAPIALPGFWPADGAPTGREIEIVWGPVPRKLADPVCQRPLVQIDRGGTCLHHVPGVARYRVSERRLITVEPYPGAALDRVLSFLRATPLYVLCYQWGLLPLNAACVAESGKAVLLAGGTASGKSTLAVALSRRGYRIMADDDCALAPGNGDGPIIWPGFPEVRVWPESVAALGLSAQASGPGPGGLFTVPVDNVFAEHPAAPKTVLLMNRPRGGLPSGAQRVAGFRVFEALAQLAHIPEVARDFLGGNAVMTLLVELAARVAVIDWRYGYALAELEQEADEACRLIAAPP